MSSARVTTEPVETGQIISLNEPFIVPDCSEIKRVADASVSDLQQWYVAQANLLIALIRKNGGTLDIEDTWFNEQSSKPYRMYVEFKEGFTRLVAKEET